MRCLALAQAWHDEGGHAVFAMRHSSPPLRHRLEAEGISIRVVSADAGSPSDASSTAEIAAYVEATWVAIDGYVFGSNFLREVRESVEKLLVIDDFGTLDPCTADLVVHPSLDPGPQPTAQSDRPVTLIGAAHALLRREFHSWNNWEKDLAPSARRILVSFGGADTAGLTQPTLDRLSKMDRNLEIRSLRGLTSAAGEQPIDHVPRQMAWADLAVAAAGGTAFELAFMGLPAVLLPVAPNQEPVAEAAQELGLARVVGATDSAPDGMANLVSSLIDDEESRRGMSRRGRSLVDRRGAWRIVHSMIGTSSRIAENEELALRPATLHDTRSFWEWRNDPETRSSAFRTELIPWSIHVEWFESKLNDPACRFFVGERAADGEPIGQVRFERTDPLRAEIHVVIAPLHRRRGLGSRLIAEAVSQYLAEVPVNRIDAFIKPENEGSLRAFTRAGFSPEATVRIKDRDAAHYARSRK
ncbi:MAG TPA: bifunctional UDP-2,4-diacetamido-2,4,6-trideoxy-beta-L-altropyranose hydrolase/GNAT family N-acetyltransferase [Thermoanaerobaculia bacterium]|nr:bifunctional UDP-2,4-diacetamido-2,4,6-trideoxy-beta-L-altropyranose hydrolase/GNAT family N-acetyltransferase [Thermoanaerobaculia bacterium]